MLSVKLRFWFSVRSKIPPLRGWGIYPNDLILGHDYRLSLFWKEFRIVLKTWRHSSFSKLLTGPNTSLLFRTVFLCLKDAEEPYFNKHIWQSTDLAVLCFQVSLMNCLFYMPWVFALPYSHLRPYASNISTVWSCFMVICKMMYQLKFVKPLEYSSNCTKVSRHNTVAIDWVEAQ